MKTSMNSMILQKIRKIMERKGIKQNTLAEMIGVVPQNLNAYMTGRRRFGEKKIEQIAKALDVPPESLYTIITDINPASDVQVKRIPVISWLKAGQWHEGVDVFAEGYADSWMYYDTKDMYAFALLVEENSMSPEFKAGDIIIVSPSSGYSFGDYVVARYVETVVFKQLKLIGNTVLLQSLNNQYDDIILSGVDKEELKVIGKVVAKYVKY
ncbi:MAG: XRE family transcriptional regulator [Candidatus Magnetoovum sp. WYHC-5]|nr:XRE family transcriptional regulator [Candidatus Magnetoovum sp. WYHC-5]